MQLYLKKKTLLKHHISAMDTIIFNLDMISAEHHQIERHLTIVWCSLLEVQNKIKSMRIISQHDLKLPYTQCKRALDFIMAPSLWIHTKNKQTNINHWRDCF